MGEEKISWTTITLIGVNKCWNFTNNIWQSGVGGGGGGSGDDGGGSKGEPPCLASPCRRARPISVVVGKWNWWTNGLMWYKEMGGDSVLY